MSVVGTVPWRLVAQEAWRHFENMTRGHEKEAKTLETHMTRPLAPLPMTEPPRKVVSKSGWTLESWKQGQRGKLNNA